MRTAVHLIGVALMGIAILGIPESVEGCLSTSGQAMGLEDHAQGNRPQREVEMREPRQSHPVRGISQTQRIHQGGQIKDMLRSPAPRSLDHHP